MNSRNRDVLDSGLNLAATNGDIDMVKRLLERQSPAADVHANNDIALRTATRRNHIDIVRLLLDHGADLHVLNDNPLRVAAANNHIEIATLLLNRGAYVNAVDDYRDSALTLAAASGHADMVTMLMDRGATVTTERYNSLLDAVSRGYLDVVGVLVSRGADVNVVNNDGLSALQVAAGTEYGFRENLDMMEFLLSSGADIRVDHDRLLTRAIFACRIPLVDFLLEHGAFFPDLADRVFVVQPQLLTRQAMAYFTSKGIHVYDGDVDDDDQFEPDFEDVDDSDPEAISTCVARAIAAQNALETILFQRQQEREAEFTSKIQPFVDARKESAVSMVYKLPATRKREWNLFAVYAVGYKPNCNSQLCFEYIFEVVRAPVWEWAVTLAVLSHFDRSNADRNPGDAWAGNFLLVTDLLARTVNLATGQVFQSYCVGRCLDGTDENCLLRELLLPVLMFDAAPPRIEEIPEPGPHYEDLASLYSSNGGEIDCPICITPLEASQFLLVRRLRQYQNENVLFSLEGVIPGSSDSIEKIQKKKNDTSNAENMPVRLFTCTHKFHVTCIATWYCQNIKTPQCPVCRAPMLRNRTERRQVPTSTVYYPTSI